MQNAIQKFGQSSIVYEKQVILSDNLKTLMSSSYPTQVNIFCSNFAHIFYLLLSKQNKKNPTHPFADITR